MFHIDVYDFLPEIKRGVNADNDVMAYLCNTYPWFTFVSSKIEGNTHTSEENPYLQVIASLEVDTPRELMERFGQRVTKLGYSFAPREQYTVTTNQGSEMIDTYDISRNGVHVMAIGYKEHPIPISLFATSLVNYYTDHDVLLQAARLLHIHGLVPDNAPLSHKVLAELDEILERAESEPLREFEKVA